MSLRYDSTILVDGDEPTNRALLDLLKKINEVSSESKSAIQAILDITHPVGEVFIQLPGQPIPQNLYGGTWLNITSLYAGLFFRVEGGNALAFEAGTQDFAFQRHYHEGYVNTGGTAGANNWIQPVNAQGGTTTLLARLTPDGLPSIRQAVSDVVGGTVNMDTETRPVNQSIRIWKRSA